MVKWLTKNQLLVNLLFVYFMFFERNNFHFRNFRKSIYYIGSLSISFGFFHFRLSKPFDFFHFLSVSFAFESCPPKQKGRANALPNIIHRLRSSKPFQVTLLSLLLLLHALFYRVQFWLAFCAQPLFHLLLFHAASYQTLLPFPRHCIQVP